MRSFRHGWPILAFALLVTSTAGADSKSNSSAKYQAMSDADKKKFVADAQAKAKANAARMLQLLDVAKSKTSAEDLKYVQTLNEDAQKYLQLLNGKADGVTAAIDKKDSSSAADLCKTVENVAYDLALAVSETEKRLGLSSTGSSTASGGSGDDAPPPEVKCSSHSMKDASDDAAKVQEAVVAVSKLQDMAEKKKDIIKLNCVNDKLSQVKAHAAATDSAKGDLSVAIGKNDVNDCSHQLSLITIHYQKVLVLKQEAQNCIGSDISYIGDTQVTVDIDPDITDVDVTAYGLPKLDTTRPTNASSL